MSSSTSARPVSAAELAPLNGRAAGDRDGVLVGGFPAGGCSVGGFRVGGVTPGGVVSGGVTPGGVVPVVVVPGPVPPPAASARLCATFVLMAARDTSRPSVRWPASAAYASLPDLPWPANHCART